MDEIGKGTTKDLKILARKGSASSSLAEAPPQCIMKTSNFAVDDTQKGKDY